MSKKKKEYINKLNKEFEDVKDKEGRSLIGINVRNEDDFLSPFSMNKSLISNELAEFLNHQLNPSVLKNGIHINITSSFITDEKEKEYEDAIRNYYEIELLNKTKEIRKNNIIALLMLIFGTIVLGVSILFNVLEILTIVASVIDIIAWVFIWEAVDLYFLQRPKIEIEEIKAFEMINSKITFNEKVE